MDCAGLKALATFVALGAVAHASLPYLPLIGPPPLRVQVVKSPPVSVVKFQAKPTLPAAKPPLAGAADASAVPALAVTATNVTAPAMPVVFALPVAETPGQSLGDAFSSSVFDLPTPDLLGITPQMLATYFRPIHFGTNAAVLAGPFHVSFVPPLPPDKSSHAEYIVK